MLAGRNRTQPPNIVRLRNSQKNLTQSLPMNRPNRREVLECGGWRGMGLTPLLPVRRQPVPKRCVPSPLTHRSPKLSRANPSPLRFKGANRGRVTVESLPIRWGEGGVSPGEGHPGALRFRWWCQVAPSHNGIVFENRVRKSLFFIKNFLDTFKLNVLGSPKFPNHIVSTRC